MNHTGATELGMYGIQRFEIRPEPEPDSVMDAPLTPQADNVYEVV